MKNEESKMGNLKIRGPEVFFLVSLFFSFLFFSGCSSTSNKPPEEIFTTRNTAVNQLNLANQASARGQYQDALLYIQEAWRLAASADDPSLRIKTSMTRGSIFFSLGRHDDAFSEWDAAQSEGDSSGEPLLAALTRIYIIRARLVLLGGETDANTDSVVEDYKTQLAREMTLVRSDSLATATGHVTLGFAEKQLGRWTEAENAVKQALTTHEKNRNLEDAAYDWFIIASIRSVAGNYDASLEALRMAISFDRRAENGFGLASSWQAMGDVYQKAGKTEESQAAYRRAADIYRAINLSDLANKLEQ